MKASGKFVGWALQQLDAMTDDALATHMGGLSNHQIGRLLGACGRIVDASIKEAGMRVNFQALTEINQERGGKA